MEETWAGFSNSASELTVIVLRFLEASVEVTGDMTWALQKGERSDAYRLMYARIVNELKEGNIHNVAVKGSVVSSGPTTLSHLYAAELRGIIIAAASQSAENVKVITKTAISKGFGVRNVDAYVADDSFWSDTIEGKVRKGSRETALLVLAARKS